MVENLFGKCNWSLMCIILGMSSGIREKKRFLFLGLTYSKYKNTWLNVMAKITMSSLHTHNKVAVNPEKNHFDFDITETILFKDILSNYVVKFSLVGYV